MCNGGLFWTAADMTPSELKDVLGTQTEIAKALGIAQSSVAEWFSNGEIPYLRQVQIELASGGLLRADPPVKPIEPRSSQVQSS